MDATNRGLALLGLAEIALRFEERAVPCVPIGQRPLAEAVLKSADSEETFHGRLEAEYNSVVDVLLEARVPFRILNLAQTESSLAEGLREEGFPSFDMPVHADSPARFYPRDLFAYFPEKSIALLEQSSFTIDEESRNGVELRPSCWGEGGRIIAAGDRIVLSRHPDKPRAREQNTLDKLRDRGIVIAEIPAGIACALDDSAAITSVFYDPHTDRVASLIMDPGGAYHLFIPPTFQTGPLTAPLDHAQSIDEVRRACETAEVEVHITEQMKTPMGTSLVQFPNGVVVTGCNESQWLSQLQSIAGPDKVFAAEPSLAAYPAFGGAGIHCLVTESPEFFLAG